MPSAALSCASKDLWAARVRSSRRFSIAETKIWALLQLFLRLGTPFRLRKAETGYREADYLRFYAADLCFGTLRQSLIAKSCNLGQFFVFGLWGGLEAARAVVRGRRFTYRKENNAIGEAGLVLSVGWLGFASDALDAVSARSAKRIVFKGMKQ